MFPRTAKRTGIGERSSPNEAKIQIMIEDFTTDRLSVRPLGSDDLDFLIELDGDVEVMAFITGRPGTPERIAAELEGSLGTRWLVFDADHTFLGWVGAVPDVSGVEFDVGWRFRRDAWGHGFATEAARALIDALFAEGARRVFAQTMAVNERSRAVMSRVGLRYNRTFHLHFDDPLPGTELGEVEYELTRDDWQQQRR